MLIYAVINHFKLTIPKDSTNLKYLTELGPFVKTSAGFQPSLNSMSIKFLATTFLIK